MAAHLRARFSDSNLLVGDVVLFTGGSVFSKLVRFVEGTSFDHVALIAPPNVDDEQFGRDRADDRTDELWMVEVGFGGGRWAPISTYDDSVRALSIRRHRTVGAGIGAFQRAKEVAAVTKGYAWDRLLFLSLVGATRWSPGLSELHSREAGAFVRALYEVLGQMRKTGGVSGSNRRICTEVVTEGFDTFGSVDGAQAPYFGVVVPQRAHEGVLWWATGVEDFGDFLASRPVPRRRSVLELDVDLIPDPSEAGPLLQELAAMNGASFAGMTETSDAQLRELVVDGVSQTLKSLVGDAWTGAITAVSDPRRLAWFLLDQLMRRRLVVTPADIGESKSLYDVGHVDPTEINWRRTTKGPQQDSTSQGLVLDVPVQHGPRSRDLAINLVADPKSDG